MTEPDFRSNDGRSAPDLADNRQSSAPSTPTDVPAQRNGTVRLDRGMERAIASPPEGKPITDPAADLGVHPTSVHRRLNDPAFERELSDRREAFLDSTLDFLAYDCGDLRSLPNPTPRYGSDATPRQGPSGEAGPGGLQAGHSEDESRNMRPGSGGMQYNAPDATSERCKYD